MPQLNPTRIALAYASFGTVWILVSDLVVDRIFGDRSASLAAQSAKGLLYIAATTLLVYWLAHRGHSSALHQEASARARADLDAARSLQSAVVDVSPLPLLTLDLDGRVLTWNESSVRAFGWTAEEVIGEVLPIVAPEKMREFDVLRHRVSSGEAFSGLEVTRPHKRGTPLELRLSTAPIRDAGGEVVGVMAAYEDVTEIQHAAAALRRSEARRARIEQIVGFGTWEWDVASDTFAWSEGLYAIFGLDPDRDPPRFGDHDQLFLSDDVDRLRATVEATVATGEPYELELRAFRADGAIRTCAVRGQAETGVDGTVVRLYGWIHDITERKSRELELESQLRQAQKLEAIGSLAGGIAHDFNNMLTVILGNLEMVLDATAAGDPRREELEEIRAAGLRSSELVAQLLAFARKQIIAPRTLDLDTTVEARLGMLHRLIGEDLDLRWRPSGDCWAVLLDPAQLDQILTNLLINARDAIEGIGLITIETGNVEIDDAYCSDHAGFRPGQYVMLAVSDTGRGMDQATVSRIFDPFFTTKPMDHGTGLGLSTVYGIVKQNEGFIHVYSEPEEGSTFRIYLARHVGEATALDAATRPMADEKGAVTVLVVEDDPPLLRLAVCQLEGLGYTVLSASDPVAAIRLADEHEGVIRLLLTDVVLPNMNGRVLYEQLFAARPNLECLYMSGYTSDVIAHRGVLEEGVHFLQKPFTARSLTTALRKALSGTLPSG